MFYNSVLAALAAIRSNQCASLQHNISLDALTRDILELTYILPLQSEAEQQEQPHHSIRHSGPDPPPLQCHQAQPRCRQRHSIP